MSKIAIIVLASFMLLAACSSDNSENKQPTDNTQAVADSMSKIKKLFVIYENHEQRHMSDTLSHSLLRKYPGVYAIYIEGTENDFANGQKMNEGLSSVTLFKEDPKYRRTDKKFLDYMFDRNAMFKHSLDLDTVVNWIAQNYPEFTIYADYPYWKLPVMVEMKDSFTRSFHHEKLIMRLAQAYRTDIIFENYVAKTIANYSNAHLIIGVAHARVTHLLCSERGYKLIGVYHPGMDDPMFSHYTYASVAKYLVLPDSVYQKTD